MKSRQFFILSALALAASLTACGGGGGATPPAVAATPITPIGTPPAITPPVAVYTLANLPTSTYGALTPERAMFTMLNTTRVGGGFGALEQSTAIDSAAKAHADYIVANYFTASGGFMNAQLSFVQGDGILTAHTETVGSVGFTGSRTADRLAAVGYRLQDSNEVISFSNGAKPGDEPVVTDCLSKLFNLAFHRSLLVSPLYVDVGIGVSGTVIDSNGYKYKTCVLDFGRTGSIPSFPDNFTGIYPFDGQIGVPLAMDPEVPDPAPEYTVKGSPVSFQGVYQKNLTVTSFELRDANSLLVQTKLLTRAQTTNLSSNEAYLIPNGALKPNSTYYVSFTGFSNGVPLSKSWSFKTAAN